METLRQKARVLSLAWLHQIADAAIDTHSIPVVQQYIRDLEQAIADLREAHALHAVNSALAGTSSIDDITARIQSHADVAHARLQQEVGTITPQPDPVADVLAQSAVQQRLAARKARLGLPPAGGTTVTELPQQ